MSAGRETRPRRPDLLPLADARRSGKRQDCVNNKKKIRKDATKIEQGANQNGEQERQMSESDTHRQFYHLGVTCMQTAAAGASLLAGRV